MSEWQDLLVRLDATPGATWGLGATIRSGLASAGAAYDRYFPAGTPSTLVESGAHITWQSDYATYLSGLDDVRRIAEIEATANNRESPGSPLVRLADESQVLLAPTVATPLDDAPGGTETRARLTITPFVFSASEIGTLGNAIRVAVTTTMVTTVYPQEDPIEDVSITQPVTTVTAQLQASSAGWHAPPRCRGCPPARSRC